MTKVFVDTAAWIALLNVRDNLHHQVNKVMDRLLHLETPLVTTEFVLLEVADALCTPVSRIQTVAFINSLRLLKSMQIIPFDQKLLDEGWMLYSQRPDKDWGLTDCISFAVMTQEGITQVFTSDHHFKQAGFTIGLTQELSETFISPCRASCYNSWNPRNALASLRPLRFDFPLPVRKSCTKLL